MLKAPCKDCSDRRVGCHSVCEKYLAFDKDRKAYLARRRDIIKMEFELYKISRYSKRRKIRK